MEEVFRCNFTFQKITLNPILNLEEWKWQGDNKGKGKLKKQGDEVIFFLIAKVLEIILKIWNAKQMLVYNSVETEQFESC